jgi:hypothetical protein
VIAFLVDHNFNQHIVDGLTRRDPAMQLIQVRDVGLATASDQTILEWAAERALVLLTHDRNTVPLHAQARVAGGLLMPGVFLVRDDMPIGQAIDEILIAAICLLPAECENLVRYFPL